MTMTIREAYAQGSTDLKFAEIPAPALDASILLAHVLKTNRTSLIAKGIDTISAKDCKKYCALIERRALGECVAYLIGKKEFRGLEFEVNKSVLVPRPDTETLVEAALKILSEEFTRTSNRRFGGGFNIKILDLCTGSGAVAIALKNEKPELEVHATDISSAALKVAIKNSENLLGKNKISFYVIIALKNEMPHIDAYATDISPEALNLAKANASHLLPNNKIHFHHGDLFQALPTNSSVSPCELFSLIVSNPPYVPTNEIETLSAEVQNEPRLALDGGACGLEIIKRIIEDAPNYLQKGGSLLLEADPRQMEEIKTLLAKRGFTSLQLFKDLSGADRVIGGIFE